MEVHPAGATGTWWDWSKHSPIGGGVPTTCKREDQHFLSFPGQHELNLQGSLDPPHSNAATEPSTHLFGSQTEASLGDSSLHQTSRSGLWQPYVALWSLRAAGLRGQGWDSQLHSGSQPSRCAEASAPRPSQPLVWAANSHPAFPCAAQPSKTGQAKQFSRWGKGCTTTHWRWEGPFLPTGPHSLSHWLGLCPKHFQRTEGPSKLLLEPADLTTGPKNRSMASPTRVQSKLSRLLLQQLKCSFPGMVRSAPQQTESPLILTTRWHLAPLGMFVALSWESLQGLLLGVESFKAGDIPPT